MVRAIHRLRPLQVKQLKAPGMYPDGGGLYLRVTNAAAKSWLFRYKADSGRERYMGLGPAHTISIDRAREEARRCREMRLDGIDPIEARKAARDNRIDAEAARVRDTFTFKVVAEEYLKLHGDGWKSAKHRDQWGMTLRTYAYPKLGHRNVTSIDEALINEALQPIWTTVPATASRTKQRIGRVLKWIKDGKPLPLSKAANGKQPALPYNQLGAFMADLRANDSVSARALELTILAAVRTSESLLATWDEIDLKDGVWSIPAERMKAGREHRVPLSDRAIQILKGLPREVSNRFVFIGGRAGKPLSNMAMNQLIRGINDERQAAYLPRWTDPKQGNRDIVPHGFRSTFRDWAGDCTGYPNHVVEQALAHTIGDKVEAAYRRSDLFQKRRRLMADWARYCAQSAAQTSHVVPLLSAS